MPRGSSSENIHSDYRETQKTSSSFTINTSSVGSVHSNHTATAAGEYTSNIGSDRRSDPPNNYYNERDYSNISFDPSKNIILTKFFNSTRTNYSAYENLCSGCGYGVFEARGKLCNFCQYVVNGYPEDSGSNIYENICDKCSQLYSGTECSVCFVKNNKVNKIDKVPTATTSTSTTNKTTSKKLKKRLFHSLLGSLKRVKSFNVPTVSVPNDNIKVSTTSRKLQIVHNVDGYDNVFRTNETFDLNRICELKRLKSSTSDHHIYGKLRKSYDHLHQTPYECVKQKSQSDDYLIGGTGCEPIFRSISINSHYSVADNDSVSLSSSPYLRQALRIENSVGEWMTSLRCETHEYYSFGAPDTVICNPKNIPANFTNVELFVAKQAYIYGGCCATSISRKEATYSTAGDDQQLFRTTTPVAGSEVVTLRSFSNESKQVDIAQQMVNEFKRNLMEKQQASNLARHLRTKRQGIYLNLNGIDESKQQRASNYQTDLVGDQRSNCLSPSLAQSQAVPIELTAGSENSRRGVAHQLSKRCCIYEKDSEFVSDILQAFDSFLLRDSDDVVVKEKELEENKVSSEAINEINSHAIVSHRRVVQSDSNFVFVLPQEIDIEAILQQLALSKSLNKIVISYDHPLKVFLSAVDQSAHYSQLKFSKLHKKFNRFRVFLSRSERRYVKNPTSAVSSDCQRARSLATSENIPVIDNISGSQVPLNIELISQVEFPLNSAIMTVPNGTTISNTKEEEEEPIYQPIWKFKTVGEVQENYITDEYYDHLPRTCDSSSVSIAGVDIEDHDEWEPDDEFTFTTKLDASNGSSSDNSTKEADTLSVNTTKSSSGSTITGYASSISTMTIASTSSITHHIFRNICIFYSPREAKIRAVLYEYDRNRCSSYFAQQPPIKQIGRGTNVSPPTTTTITTTSADTNNSDGNKLKKSSESGGRIIADSVQAWKYMLLDVNYLEDEEDMIVSESQILKAQAIKEMDNTPPPVGILQRFKSISSGNLLDVPAEEDKKSITERVRNKLQRGVFKLQTRSPKENKKGRNIFRRNEATSLYLEDGMKPKYPIFKAPLENLELNETSYPDVPRFVVDCIEYIEQKDCIQMDGLYRASGNKVAIDELKQKLTESYIYDPKLLVTDDIHTLTSLLKQFFRELGSPLIPEDTYRRLGATRNLMEPSAIDSMKIAFKEMKNPNRATLKFLIKHLTTVAHYSNENRMPASNLAIVWGPCILSVNQIEYDIARMNTLAKVLIENYDRIFGDNERLVS